MGSFVANAPQDDKRPVILRPKNPYADRGILRPKNPYADRGILRCAQNDIFYTLRMTILCTQMIFFLLINMKKMCFTSKIPSLYSIFS